MSRTRRLHALRPFALSSCLGALFLSAVAGCRPAAPSWTVLARGFDPADNVRTAAAEGFRTPSGIEVQSRRLGSDLLLELPLVRERWSFLEAYGVWTAVHGLRLLHGDDLLSATLQQGGHALERAESGAGPERTRLAPGTFLLARELIALGLGPEQEPTDDAELALVLRRGAPHEGVWEVAGRRFSGPGMSVLPGERARRSVEVGNAARLRFATTAESLFAEDADTARKSVRFRIEHEGRTLFEHSEAVEAAGRYAWHELDLPPGDVALDFVVDGDPALTAFLAPVVGPRVVGDPGERPWGSTRPDVVVFVADTFRADNLRACGGTRDLAPRLEELAAESLFFPRTWSVGTYTNPAHASMFCGVYPRQAGILDASNAIPEDMRTIAELFGAAGYRTGAVTDAVVLSRALGMHQGFEWFDEHRADLDSTFRRAEDFLDADDGRPVLLFVHTYATHSPFQVTEETRRERGAELGIRGDYDETWARILELAAGAERDSEPSPEVVEAIEALRGLYLGGVVDFDRDFRRFHQSLEQRGLLEGYFVFLSDHGEAFMEHDLLFHGGTVWEEVTRVPLMITGPGLEARTVDVPASLVDLAPTLAEMAGIAPLEEWEGRSLFGLDEVRPLFFFQCTDEPGSTWGVVEGKRKAIGAASADEIARGELLGAFDLGQDPGEREDLSETADWASGLAERMGQAWGALSEPLARTREVSLSAEQRASLSAMGYGGQD